MKLNDGTNFDCGGISRAMPHVAGSDLEKSELRLGIIPLTDCAVLIAAKERGFFERQGLCVEITRESSWAGIRDKLAAGVLDAAHPLAGIPIAATLGIEALDCPMVTAISLDLNGNAVTVSRSLADRMNAVDSAAMHTRQTSVQALAKVIENRKAESQPPLTFAVVHPFSSHNYLLRYWLASGGINPGRDLKLVVVPPPRMVEAMADGKIDGYCVGEPWNTMAVVQGLGRTIVTGHDIWQNAPEKVLGVTKTWAEAHPKTHRALVRALIEAAMWADEPDHREELVSLMAAGSYVDVPESVLKPSMVGQCLASQGSSPLAMPDYHVFYRYAATYPWRSQAVWFIAQMIRWGDLDRQVDIRGVARSVYQSELYRAAAADLGLNTPTVDEKEEGLHSQHWLMQQANKPILMGPDRFCDGAVFNPRRPLRYLAQFPIAPMSHEWQNLSHATA